MSPIRLRLSSPTASVMAFSRGLEILPDRREQDRAHPVAFAHAGELARLALEPGALERERHLVEQIVEQRQLVGDRPAARHRRARGPPQRSRRCRTHRMELPFGGDCPVDARGRPRSPLSSTSAAAAMSLGVRPIERRRARRAMRGCGQSADQRPRCIRRAGQARAYRDIARSPARRCRSAAAARGRRWSHCAPHAPAAIRACRRTDAASWLVTTATTNRTTTVTMSFGLSMRKVR